MKGNQRTGQPLRIGGARMPAEGRRDDRCDLGITLYVRSRPAQPFGLAELPDD